MRVTKPYGLEITATNIAASSYTAWSSATTYAVGDKVKYPATVTPAGPYLPTPMIREYEALTISTNKTPAVGGTDDWLDLGPSNQYRMFDDRTGTSSVRATSIDVTVEPGAFFDHIALLRLDGALSVRIKVGRGATILYDETIDVSEDATDWSDYFFGDRDGVRTAVSVTPQVFYSDAWVQTIITGTTGVNVGLGLLLVGRGRDLGVTIETPSIGIEDYSTKETDTFGNTYLLEREYADRASVQMILETGQVDAVRRELAKYRATPALYDLNNAESEEAYDSLLIFGFYESFDVSLGYPGKSYCSLDVQSLI